MELGGLEPRKRARHGRDRPSAGPAGRTRRLTADRSRSGIPDPLGCFPMRASPAPPPFLKEAAGRAGMRTLVLSAEWVGVFVRYTTIGRTTAFMKLPPYFRLIFIVCEPLRTVSSAQRRAGMQSANDFLYYLRRGKSRNRTRHVRSSNG